jgi:hypothetical protein
MNKKERRVKKSNSKKFVMNTNSKPKKRRKKSLIQLKAHKSQTLSANLVSLDF